MSRGPAVLSIHAVDGLAEEGVLADAAVCAELHCRPVSVVASVLVTRDGQIDAMESLSLGLVAQQLESVLASCRPAAARTGLLADPRQIELVAELIETYGLPDPVVAPVLRVAGVRVVGDEALGALRRFHFPLARVLIARAGDLEILVGHPAPDVESLKSAAAALRGQGARAVIISGATWRGRVIDLLDDDGRVSLFDSSRVNAPRIGGLSGAHAAALTAHLARGQSLVQSADAAQRYVSFRLQRSV